MKEKKRLLIIHSAIAPYRVDFFNALSKEFDTKIVLFAGEIASRPYAQQDLLSKLDVTPIFKTERYGKVLLKWPKGYMSLLREYHPDFILTLEFSLYAIIPLIYRSLFNKSCKVYSIVDDSYYMLTEGEHHSKVHTIAEKILLPRMDDVINLEPRVSAFFQEHYGRGICFPIMHDPIQIRPKFQKALPLAEKYIETHNLQDKKVFLYVGRLIPLKNLHSVIDSFLCLPQEQVALVLVGDGTQEQELKQKTDGKQNIILTGRLSGDNLYAWYNVADIFVLASTQECYGAVTNEALNAGCLAIVSRNAGSQCLINEGINGFVIDPSQKSSISSAMKKSIDLITKHNRPLALKPNLMPFCFNDYIQELVTRLNR